MTTTTIGGLATAATLPLTGDEFLVLEQSGTTKNVTAKSILQPEVNAEAYGAAGDLKVTTDVTSTSGQAAITSPSNPWTSADVGKKVLLAGGGVAGADLFTTVLSYQSAGQISLTAAPSTSIAGSGILYWYTDDTTALTNALAGLASGQSLKLAPGKHYTFTSAISVLGKPLRIEGDGATLDWLGSSSSNSNPVQTVSGATNATPIQLTVTAHSRSVGDLVYVKSVLGNTAANGWFMVSAVADANTLSLAQSAGNGAYTSGGTLQLLQVCLTLGFASASALASKANSQPVGLQGVRLRYRDGVSSPLTNSFIGLRLQNVYSGVFDMAAADGFGVGLNMMGDGTGCTTSTFRPRQFKNCGVNCYFTAINNGYVSEITCLGGDWIYSVQAGKQAWHVKADLTAGSSFGGNCFQDSCFQVNDNSAWWAQIADGDHWKWDLCRFESVNHSATVLQLAATCIDCEVVRTTGPITDLQVQDFSTSNPGNYFQPGSIKPWARLYNSTAAAGPNGTVTPTSLIGTGLGMFGSSQSVLTLPAYYMNRGRRLKGKAWGWITTDASTPAAVTFILTIGSNTFTFASTGTLATSLTNSFWTLEFEAVERVIGSGTSARVQVFGEYRFTNVSGAASKTTTPILGGYAGVAGTTDDNTATKNINLTATLSVAANNNLQCEQFTLDGC